MAIDNAIKYMKNNYQFYVNNNLKLIIILFIHYIYSLFMNIMRGFSIQHLVKPLVNWSDNLVDMSHEDIIFNVR